MYVQLKLLDSKVRINSRDCCWDCRLRKLSWYLSVIDETSFAYDLGLSFAPSDPSHPVAHREPSFRRRLGHFVDVRF